MVSDITQLDFIGSPKVEREPEQFNLWDSRGKPTKVKKDINFSPVENLFNGLDTAEVQTYKTYWDSVAPRNDTEIFQRYLFAFMSVHTTWEANVKGYEAIKDWTNWFKNDEKLMELIKGSRVGLHNNRVRFISRFAQKFWQDPEWYKYDGGNWQTFRNRLVKNILGLGIAKVSFSLEMIYPNTAKVTCMDTHLFQAYGLDQSKDANRYSTIENHWLDMCSMWQVPSYIARCILWDRKQNEPDSRYWSYVLEG
jgi:thermostable 8-oxoguanine DNA glycosylase